MTLEEIFSDLYNIFHLTYSAHNADGFPRYEEFTDRFAVKEFMEKSFLCDSDAGRRVNE